MLLASVCNTPSTIKSPFLLIEEDLSAYRHVKTPLPTPEGGVTGIALTADSMFYAQEGSVVVALWYPSMIHKASVRLKNAADIHSMMVIGKQLFVMAAGMNAMIVADISGGIPGLDQVFWKARKHDVGSDLDHLNSICLHENRILASGFGKKTGNLWSSCTNGFVVDVANNQKIHEGLCQPHSLSSIDGHLFICESARGRIINLRNGKTSADLNGYVRGLCKGSLGLYAAVSKGRSISKSTGLTVTNPAEGGDTCGQSAIYLLDIQTLEKKKAITIPDREFYDLTLVGNESSSIPLYGPA